MKRFFLTSTNPCVNNLWSSVTDVQQYESNSFASLLECANRFAIGESNCDGCEHYYAITNRKTGRSFVLSALDLASMHSRRHPWLSSDGGLTRTNELRDSFMQEAALALECTVDELLAPVDDGRM